LIIETAMIAEFVTNSHPEPAGQKVAIFAIFLLVFPHFAVGVQASVANSQLASFFSTVSLSTPRLSSTAARYSPQIFGLGV
jgi:hypothetical protein